MISPCFPSSLFKYIFPFPQSHEYHERRSKVLNASHNAIKLVDNTTFDDAGNLQFLDLSHNQLTNMQPRTFVRLRQLDSLKLNNNSIESISDDAFDGLNLSYLDLSCNKLRSEDFLWPSTVNVRFLNLTFNDFVEINVSVLEHISVDLWGEFWWWNLLFSSSWFRFAIWDAPTSLQYLFIFLLLLRWSISELSKSILQREEMGKIQYHYDGRLEVTFHISPSPPILRRSKIFYMLWK